MSVGANPKGNIPYKFETNINKNNTKIKGKYTLPFSQSAFRQYPIQIYTNFLKYFD